MKARFRRKCPEDCSYKDRRTGFCGFCMLDILERKEEKHMQMMVEEYEAPKHRKASETKTLKEMVEELDDGEVLSLSLKGMEVTNGQET